MHLHISWIIIKFLKKETSHGSQVKIRLVILINRRFAICTLSRREWIPTGNYSICREQENDLVYSIHKNEATRATMFLLTFVVLRLLSDIVYFCFSTAVIGSYSFTFSNVIKCNIPICHLTSYQKANCLYSLARIYLNTAIVANYNRSFRWFFFRNEIFHFHLFWNISLHGSAFQLF